MDARPTPYTLGTEDGEALWFFGTLATFKATAEQTGGQYTLIEQVAPRGVATPLHVQPEDHESFYVLEGELTFYLEDGRPIPASAGSFVHIPRGRRTPFR
jgi:quercetin dioxygenase-like cupin family protein